MRVVFVFLCLLASLSSFAQEETVVNIKEQKSNEGIFVIVDEQPQFPGGERELIKFYQKESKFKVSSNRDGSSTVFTQMIVNKDGIISDLKILRSPSDSLSKEVQRLVELMPEWEPGKKGDKNVRVRITQEIHFVPN
jgi:protein TonB